VAVHSAGEVSIPTPLSYYRRTLAVAAGEFMSKFNSAAQRPSLYAFNMVDQNKRQKYGASVAFAVVSIICIALAIPALFKASNKKKGIATILVGSFHMP